LEEHELVDKNIQYISFMQNGVKIFLCINTHKIITQLLCVIWTATNYVTYFITQY